MREKQYGTSDPRIAQYVMGLLNPESGALTEIRRRGLESGLPAIQVGPMDARHLEVLTRMVRPRRALEIGTLFGYSTWAILQGVDPEKGCLWTLEKSEKHASVARESLEWALKAHLAKAPDVKLAEHRIVTGPALQSLATLEGEGPFDFVFIDADKAGYAAYWNWCQSHVRQGGVVVADNTFVWGLIADDPERLDEPDRRAVLALREFNRQISQNTNWNTTFLPTAEGLSISVRL